MARDRSEVKFSEGMLYKMNARNIKQLDDFNYDQPVKIFDNERKVEDSDPGG